jgi:hypothetical protein
MNPVDQFRAAFFDKVIQEEKKQEEERRQAQAKCFHKYDMIEQTFANGYQQRSCSKCGHGAVRKITVWEGTKGCVIS